MGTLLLDFREELSRNHEAVVRLLTGAETLVIFAVGLGRYRTVLILGLFFFSTGLLMYEKKNHRMLSVLIGPLLLLGLYFDLNRGQMFPLFPRLPFLASVASLVLIDAVMVRGLAYRTLIRWSGDVLFRTCPRCRYGGRSLVDVCGQCSYRKNTAPEGGGEQSPDNGALTGALIQEIAGYRAAGLRQPSRKIRQLLALHNGEIVLMSIRVFPSRTFFKDGEKTLASCMVLTTKGVVFIQSLFFETGWKLRELIPYDDIIEITATTRFVTTTEEPTLSIKTHSHHYEICFMSLFPYREKIKAIMSCMRKRSSAALVQTDAAYNNLA